MLQLRIEGEGLVFEKEIGEGLTKEIMSLVIDRVFTQKTRPREVHLPVELLTGSIGNLEPEESSEPP